MGCIRDRELVNRLEAKVTTADVSWAGTDDDVTLTLAGRNWNLDKEGHDDFERGDTDTFQLDAGTGLHLSDLHSVRIHKSPDGFAGGWKLKGLELVANGNTIYGNQSISRWLEDDDRTCRPRSDERSRLARGGPGSCPALSTSAADAGAARGTATRLRAGRPVLDFRGLAQRLDRFVDGQKDRRLNRAKPTSATYRQCNRGHRHVVRGLPEVVAVVFAEGVPEPVELSTNRLDVVLSRLPTVLAVSDQPSPRLRRVAELRQVERHRLPRMRSSQEATEVSNSPRFAPRDDSSWPRLRLPETTSHR